MPTIGDLTRTWMIGGRRRGHRRFRRGGRGGGCGRDRIADRRRRAPLAGDANPQAVMLDFHFAQIVMTGNLGQSRNNGKIDAAGKGFARRGA